ncbi:hypothetical protein O2V63_05880 [Modestobacter sp. VKM Ac-2977]|uniref:hypothetical protein n=1 Tax=Modestobacter sp. VKM Ac-2977 TaxID=3004131 RepID=UPI0022AAB89F|nr:hypothetical protein [Modestobacter sp. VKM Ac-2977]MCZ2819851.1 hypothetical protein [Modestobacter sp. VKM Ac-2977]
MLSDGALYGTFCAAGLTTDKGLTERDQSSMTVLASAAVLLELSEHDQVATTPPWRRC